MFYRYELEILVGKTEAEPEIKTIKLPKGTIHHVEIYFPAGCLGEAKVKIEHEESQIFPSNPKEWFAGDKYPIVFDEDYKLKENFNLLKLYGYNDDTENPHTITFRIGVTGNWKYALTEFVKTVVRI